MKSDPDRAVELARLAERLRLVNPGRLNELVDLVREMVEAQEVIARQDRDLMLRPGRPTKRYSA